MPCWARRSAARRRRGEAAPGAARQTGPGRRGRAVFPRSISNVRLHDGCPLLPPPRLPRPARPPLELTGRKHPPASLPRSVATFGAFHPPPTPSTVSLRFLAAARTASSKWIFELFHHFGAATPAAPADY